MAPRWCSSAASCPSYAPTPPSWPAPAACAGASSSPANAAGGILWAGIYTFAAYLAGNALQRASHTIDLIIVGVAVLAVTGVIFVVRRQTAKLGLQAEAAYPGPLD